MLHYTEVKGKSDIIKPEADLVLVGTRVTKEQREKFAELADKQHRSAAAELRRMIEQRLEQAA